MDGGEVGGSGGRWSEEAIEVVESSGAPAQELTRVQVRGREAIQRDCTRRVSRWSAVVMAAAAVARGGGARSGAGEGGHEASTLLVLRVGGVAGEMAAAAVGMFAACGGGGT